MDLRDIQVMNSRGVKGEEERGLKSTSRFLTCAIN